MTLDYDPQALCEALASGRSAVVRGRLAGALATPQGMVIVRARCDVAAPLDAVESALTAALRVTGDGRKRVAPPATGIESLVRAMNRLAGRFPGGVALVLEGLAAVDEAALEALALVLTSPGAVRLAVVCAFERPRLDGAAESLYRALTRAGTVDVTVEATGVPAGFGARESQALAALTTEELLTLRAATVVGDSFVVDAVAAVRELSTVRALEHLQRARDLGLPLHDAGEGRLSLPADFAARVRDAVLPSLAAAWRKHLRERFGAPQPLMVRHADAAPVERVMASFTPDPDAPLTEPVVRREAPSSRRRRRSPEGE